MQKALRKIDVNYRGDMAVWDLEAQMLGFLCRFILKLHLFHHTFLALISHMLTEAHKQGIKETGFFCSLTPAIH